MIHMAGRKPVVDRASVRSKRISATLTPTAYEGLNVLAAAKGISASDVVAALVEAVVRRNMATIDEFAAAKTKAASAVDLSINDD